ncbi:MAG: hypothetical protein IT384_00035 [Deltaproteobacteria bacterium]|nr:hypothetical protein [Deltaproteobacteria bacterium]
MRAVDPKFSPVFSVAYALLKEGIDPDRLERPHFDALAEQAGKTDNDYDAKRAFSENAIATWTELPDLGVRAEYRISSLFSGDAHHDLRDRAETVENDFAAVSAFLDKANASQAANALDMIAGSARGALKKAETALAEGHVGREDDHLVALAKITTLKTIALEFGDKGDNVKAKANALAAELYDRYQALDAASSFSFVVHDVARGRVDDPGWAWTSGEAVRKIFAHAPAHTRALEMIAKLTPEQRGFMIESLSRAWGSHAQTFELPHAAQLAREVWKIDHQKEAFAPAFGSHPVLAKLFAHAGEDVRVEIAGGQSFEGRVLMVRDFDRDKEGSQPMLGLPGSQPGQALEILLPSVTKISGKEGVLYDVAVDGPVMPRSFSPMNDVQKDVITQVVGRYIVSDYSVNHEVISQLAKRVAGEIPGASTLLKQLNGLPGYMEQMVSGSIVARYLSSMLTLDLGPSVHRELAMVAYGAANGDGYKSWGFDRHRVMASGALLSKAVELTKDRAYGLVELLQYGPLELKTAVIQNAIAGLPARFEGIQTRGVPVDLKIARPFLDFWQS